MRTCASLENDMPQWFGLPPSILDLTEPRASSQLRFRVRRTSSPLTNIGTDGQEIRRTGSAQRSF